MNINLVMFQESGERRDFPLSRPVTTVGRKEDCDIRIPLAEISRHHAKFTLDDAILKILDLGSANGTFVNNKRVKESRLSAGDHVVVGPVVFTVQLDGKPNDVRAVKTKLRTLSNASPPSNSPQAAPPVEEDLDPISALEALASSADQTAIDAFDDDDGILNDSVL